MSTSKLIDTIAIFIKNRNVEFANISTYLWNTWVIGFNLGHGYKVSEPMNDYCNKKDIVRHDL